MKDVSGTQLQGGGTSLSEVVSSSLSKEPSALSQEPSARATNTAEPFAARDEAFGMKMLPAAAERLRDSSGCCILGCLHPTSTHLLDQGGCWAELGVAGVRVGKRSP